MQLTLTGHFIKDTLPVTGWTHFYLQNCSSSPWHSFEKLLLCWLHIHDVNHPKNATVFIGSTHFFSHHRVAERSVRWKPAQSSLCF